MKVVIATKNQGKIEGASKALASYFSDFEIVGIPAPSNVGEQPVNEEIYIGAKNRVKNLKEYCKQNGIEAQLYLAVESGVYNSLGKWMVTNVAVIEDDKDFESWGTSPSFPIPDGFIDEIIATDLSQFTNKIFGEDNDRHNHGGAIQLLTKGKISRIDLNEFAFTMALIKFLNKEWN